jgi:hypothetical protein
MSQVDAPPPAPRAVIRLLRSGQLSEERARRVLELHAPLIERWNTPQRLDEKSPS